MGLAALAKYTIIEHDEFEWETTNRIRVHMATYRAIRTSRTMHCRNAQGMVANPSYTTRALYKAMVPSSEGSAGGLVECRFCLGFGASDHNGHPNPRGMRPCKMCYGKGIDLHIPPCSLCQGHGGFNYAGEPSVLGSMDCRLCHGKGMAQADGRRPCGHCKGFGAFSHLSQPTPSGTRECLLCDGTGHDMDRPPCRKCCGFGSTDHTNRPVSGGTRVHVLYYLNLA